MPKRDDVRLRHMLDAARKACAFAAGRSRQDLDSEEMFALATVRLIEIVGEAAGRVSPDTRSQHPAVAWADIVGMRHRLAHGYDEVDLDIVWQVVTARLPELIVALERALGPDASGTPS